MILHILTTENVLENCFVCVCVWARKKHPRGWFFCLNKQSGYWYPGSKPEIECKDNLSTTSDTTFEDIEIRYMAFDNGLQIGFLCFIVTMKEAVRDKKMLLQIQHSS